jgi:hypothetical protein
MKLDDLCSVFEKQRFPSLGDRSHPERNSVLSARSAVAAAVVDDEFLADCISWELRRIEDDRLRRGLLPFFIIPNLGVRLAFGYWPPGGTPGPHEHTAWTITAVCRNSLEVLTYDREESYRRRELIPKNHFQAPAGRVGFIYDPCIHEPRNTTNDWSLSLHISSPRDGERLIDNDELLPALNLISKLSPAENDHPYTRVMIARQRQRFVHQLARIVASMDVPQAPHLLAQCFRFASSRTRSLIDPNGQRFGQSASEAQWTLTRTHEDLSFSCRDEGDMVALEVETLSGRIEEFVISNDARDAITFVAKERFFEVDAIPGNLSSEERRAIAEVLEEIGLFTRVQ